MVEFGVGNVEQLSDRTFGSINLEFLNKTKQIFFFGLVKLSENVHVLSPRSFICFKNVKMVEFGVGNVEQLSDR